MLDWIDLEGIGWLRLTKLKADKKRGYVESLELNQLDLGVILALCPVCDVGKCYGCYLVAYFASLRADHATYASRSLSNLLKSFVQQFNHIRAYYLEPAILFSYNKKTSRITRSRNWDGSDFV